MCVCVCIPAVTNRVSNPRPSGHFRESWRRRHRRVIHVSFYPPSGHTRTYFSLSLSVSSQAILLFVTSNYSKLPAPLHHIHGFFFFLLFLLHSLFFHLLSAPPWLHLLVFLFRLLLLLLLHKNNNKKNELKKNNLEKKIEINPISKKKEIKIRRREMLYIFQVIAGQDSRRGMKRWTRVTRAEGEGWTKDWGIKKNTSKA